MEIVAFLFAATALLGSPGPGIAALVAVGRSFQRPAALRFFAALQVGLALAAGISAFGLVGIIEASSRLQLSLLVLATIYLIWLAWKIASSPVRGTGIGDAVSSSLTSKGAFFLGVANPKAYLAFASLFGSFTLLPQSSATAEGALKWGLCVAVMIAVDLAWLMLGMTFGRIEMSAAAERRFNVLMGVAILGACILSWL